MHVSNSFDTWLRVPSRVETFYLARTEQGMAVVANRSRKFLLTA